VRLFHFSEDPALTRFEPHVARTAAEREPLVWAIDEWHAPMYCLPRDCPRACFWAGERTSDEDREHWLHGLQPRFVIAVEAGWLPRIRSTVLYRYEMPPASFSARDADSGHYVSRESVVPLRVDALTDLVAAIVGAGVELRAVDRLGPLWRRIHRDSTLHFSGTRLRNAVGYPAEFGVEGA
jgi:hypothetical protein